MSLIYARVTRVPPQDFASGRNPWGGQLFVVVVFVDDCPRRDFAQKAKSRGGTLVARAYIKESTYSLNIQSYSQY